MNINQKVQIHSCASQLPPQIVNSNDFFKSIDLQKNYGIPNNWMSRIMGIKERRIAKANVMPSDLAAKAANKAFENCPEINPDDIGALIFCGIHKDQLEPATAHNVQNKIGTNAKYVFDVTNACFGFFDGLEIAEMFVASGRVKYALIVTGEVNHEVHNAIMKEMENGAPIERVRDTMGFFSVGDAGGAMIIGQSESEGTGFKFFDNKVNSTLSDKCFYKFSESKLHANMKMGEIMDEGFIMQKSKLFKNMNQAGWNEFDWLLTHQTGKKNHEQTKSLNVAKPERVLKTFDTLGNITSATLPVIFDQLMNNEDLKKGHNIGGAFAGSGLIIGQFGYTI